MLVKHLHLCSQDYICLQLLSCCRGSPQPEILAADTWDHNMHTKSYIDASKSNEVVLSTSFYGLSVLENMVLSVDHDRFGQNSVDHSPLVRHPIGPQLRVRHYLTPFAFASGFFFFRCRDHTNVRCCAAGARGSIIKVLRYRRRGSPIKT